MQECFMVAYYNEFDVIKNSSDQSAALQMSCVVCFLENVITLIECKQNRERF